MNAVIIVPTYNERDNIRNILTKLASVTRSIPGYTFHFLVVDDDSPDGTSKVVTEFAGSHANVHLLTGKKEGLGRALLRGMEQAVTVLKADIIGQIDADLSHDPAKLPDFFAKLRGGADFVVGSRYIPGGAIPENWGIHRKIYSVVGNAIVRFGLGHLNIHDWTGGYRVFDKRYFVSGKEAVRPYSGYVFQIAFLHTSIHHGARVAEVPFHFTDRLYGHSKIAPLRYIMSIYAYIARSRFYEITALPVYKFAVVGSVGFVINTIVLQVFVALGLHPAAGSAVGAECAIISNFFLNNAWTFRDRKVSGSARWSKLVQFNISSFGALIIQTSTVWAGTQLLGMEAYFPSYIAGVFLGMIYNYMMYSRVIWKIHAKN